MSEIEAYRVSAELPFGDADAVRSDPKVGLIEIDGVYQSPMRNPNAMRERIIVGRKGSGKTLYLRAQQLAADLRGFLILEDKEPLRTATLLSIFQGSEQYISRLRRMGATVSSSADSLSLRFWTLLWERAILLSIVSIFHARRPLAKLGPSALDPDEFKDYFSDIATVPLQPLTPTAYLSMINHRVQGGSGWETYLEHPLWPELKTYAANLLRTSPEVACYIDSIDEEFDDAPALWAACQQGLFYAVFQTFSTQELFSKAHIVVAIRDIVFSAVLRTEHASRFVTNSHIRHLIWDQVTVRRFLVEKIRQLEPRFLASPRGALGKDPFENWLGFNTVRNIKRDLIEPVADYILRHSRMIPRDIVNLGNAIYSESARRRLQGKAFGEASLRKAVNATASGFAEESLNICINESLMSVDYLASVLQEAKEEHKLGVSADDPKSARMLVSSMREFMWDKVNMFIEHLGRKEQFTYLELQSALKEADLIRASSGFLLFEESGDDPYRFDNILWRHGLIAISETQPNGRRWKYNWLGASAATLMPREMPLYGLHASMVSHFKLEVGHASPVY